MNLTFRRRGVYRGRLAFDPDTGFHTDPDGRKVVTADSGLTWRYATRDDVSHIGRYQQRTVTVQGTTPDDPHHGGPTVDDPHYQEGATNPDGAVTHTRLLNDEDKVGHLGRPVHATETRPRLIGRRSKQVRVPVDEIERGDPTSTSHTEAYRA